MKTKVLILTLLGATLLAPLSSAQAGVAVIAHPSTPVSALTQEQVRQLYSGRSTKLPDGTEVQPLDQADGSPARSEFVAKVLGKTEQQVRSYWSRMIFTGKAQPPRQMNNTAEVLRAVATTPGYIGYVDSKDATSDKIKVLYKAE